MYVVFNELCENVDMPEEIARKNINHFIQFLKQIKKDKMVEGIVTPTNTFGNQTDIDQYSFTSWLNDKNVDREYKRFFRSYKGKYITYIENEENDGEFQVNINDEKQVGIGCTAAYESQNILISRATNSLWKQEIINGTYMSLDSGGELVSVEGELTNVNDSFDYEKMKTINSKILYANISSGYDLWEQRTSLYPNLIFCDSVKAHLYADPERYHIIKIMERLQILQNYFSKKHNSYDPSELGLNARTESESVKTDPELRKYRLFKMPTGEERYFYDHIGFTGKFGGGRIHFYPIIAEQKCYIGYIGRHLPTKKY